MKIDADELIEWLEIRRLEHYHSSESFWESDDEELAYRESACAIEITEVIQHVKEMADG